MTGNADSGRKPWGKKPQLPELERMIRAFLRGEYALRAPNLARTPHNPAGTP
jgi:hypothetical protein